MNESFFRRQAQMSGETTQLVGARIFQRGKESYGHHQTIITTMSTRLLLLVAVAAVFLFVAPHSQAQDVVPAPDARPSPLALTQITLDDGTYVKVHYSSPRKRGRTIFGGLVPYDSVWRLGANEATEMTTTGPIRIGDEELPAGTYSVFAIPGEDAWTLIFNRNLGQWGAFSYSEDADALRVNVPAQPTSSIHEAFAINLEEGEGDADAQLVILWDQTRLAVPIAGAAR